MATVNQVGNSLTGSTGSGAFVGATSPTLVTPTLGVSAATSINFGGSALNNYSEATAFTPTFTCATPGDLSVSYATQVGTYTRVGNVVNFYINLSCTPTFSTASGQILIASFPFTINASFGTPVAIGINATAFTYPTGLTQLIYQGITNSTTFGFAGCGSATASTNVQMSNIGSGAVFTTQLTGFYFV